MAASGLIINSAKYSSGSEYDGVWTLSSDVKGYYSVLYTHVDDGDIPICYSGVNALVVMRNSNSAQTVLHFDDLNTDNPTDVETWLETEFAPLLAAIGVTITSATAVDGGRYYDLVFNLAVTLKFSNANSTLSKLFGRSDLSGTSITLDGINIDVRPKFLGCNIAEANKIYATSDSSNVSCILSTQDDMVKNAIVYIPNETNILNIKIVRLNAPEVACPLDIRWSVVLQRNTFNILT